MKAVSVHNLGIPMAELPIVYMATGMVSIVAGSFLGRLSDAIGKYILFLAGSTLSIVVVIYYTHLGITPLWVVVIVSSFLFVGINARMISSQAMLAAVPELHDRGAFMSVNSAMQQISGGVASMLAGIIVIQTPSGMLQGYAELGYVVTGAMLVTMILMYGIHRMVGDHGED